MIKMTYQKKKWADRQTEHPARRKLNKTATPDVYDVTRDEGLIIDEGDPFNATGLNNLEERIEAGFVETVTQLDNLATNATHTKAGTVHTLTLGKVATAGIQMVQFTATADYTEGDTWSVDGTVYTAKLQGEEGAVPLDKYFIAKNLVSVLLSPVDKTIGLAPVSAGVSRRYDGEMIYFNSMPSKDRIRLAWTMPAGATGVLIRRKTMPWASGDNETTGTLVVNDTIDVDGANNWYEDVATTGQRYYYKAIPYKGNAHNVATGYNETSCNAGGLWLEYTMDNVAGTVITDTSGNARNGSSFGGTTYAQGTTGNMACGNGNPSGRIALADKLPNNFTLSLFVSFNRPDVGGYVFNLNSEKVTVGHSFNADSIFLNSYGNGISLRVPYKPSAFVTCVASGTSVKWYVDGILVGSGNGAIFDERRVFLGRSPDTGTYSGGSFATVDQVRIYSRNLNDYEISNLYNNGKGC